MTTEGMMKVRMVNVSNSSLLKIIISGFQIINVQPMSTAKIPVLLDISVPVTKEHVRSIKKRRL